MREFERGQTPRVCVIKSRYRACFARYLQRCIKVMTTFADGKDSKALLTWRVSRLARVVSADFGHVVRIHVRTHRTAHRSHTFFRRAEKRDDHLLFLYRCSLRRIPRSSNSTIIYLLIVNHTRPQIWVLREYYLFFLSECEWNIFIRFEHRRFQYILRAFGHSNHSQPNI